MTSVIDVVRHLDQYLVEIVNNYGTQTYAILAAVVFCETGLVVLPFLPGDSLLFAAGAVCGLSGSALHVGVLMAVLIVAAILGDTLNYHVGKFLGPRVMNNTQSKWLNPAHLQKTSEFFDRYGGKTIVLARFVPIVRTFAPFVAGAGAMSYRKFFLFNVVGAIAWVTSMTLAGYWLGQLDAVKKHFEFIVLGIVGISALPVIVEYIRSKQQQKA